MANKQIVRRNVPDPLPHLQGIAPFLARIYAARGIRSQEELDLSLKALAGNSTMKGLDSAAERLADAVQNNEAVLVVGDFDADGATSTALAVLGFRAMGLSNIQYLVPNRFEYGYGLTPEIVDLAASFAPKLIITVDNGISSIEGVSRATEYGIETIITDHHLPGSEIPKALAIVNPNQPGCEFLSKSAAGVGVLFYVLSAVRQVLRSRAWFVEGERAEPNLAEFLDLVALGTVADLVPLDKNNRVLVEQGLKRIRAGRCRPGIIALAQCADRELASLRPSDMGFVLGPRLNAAGRLDDMSLGIECLLADDSVRAMEFARKLDGLNRERRSIEQEMREDANEILKQHLTEYEASNDEQIWGVALYEPHWHQGVIGILAARIKEALHRPTIIFAPATDDPLQIKEIKGSARSIPGLHMRDTLDILAKKYPHLLKKFGGHAMAAGMTINLEDFEAFQHAFDQVVREVLDERYLQASLYTDGELSAQELSLQTAEILRNAGPWGQQFEEPAFDGEFRVVQARFLKEKHLKLVLSPEDSDILIDAIEFNSHWVGQNVPERLRVVYRPDVNEFRGRRNLQLLVSYSEEVENATL